MIEMITIIISVIDLFINYKSYITSLSQNKKESDEIKLSSSFAIQTSNTIITKDVTIINIYINNK